jgi:hypothetical protein
VNLVKVLGPRNQVMSRVHFDGLREQGWTFKEACLSEAWQNSKGQPKHPAVRVVQLGQDFQRPYRFIAPGN